MSKSCVFAVFQGKLYGICLASVIDAFSQVVVLAIDLLSQLLLVFVLVGYLYTVSAQLAWMLGDQWERVGEYVGVFQWLVIGVIFVLLVRFVLTRVKRRRTSVKS